MWRGRQSQPDMLLQCQARGMHMYLADMPGACAEAIPGRFPDGGPTGSRH
jgi:hypothetical protein